MVITGDFFLSDPQISKVDKDWLYPQMIKAMKNWRCYYSCLFSYKTVRFGIMDKGQKG